LLTSEDGAPKTKDLAQRDPQQKLRKRPANPTSNLSHSVHTVHMEPRKPGAGVLFALGILLLCAWALIIYMAVVVSHTLIDTLSYIVELAQMS